MKVRLLVSVFLVVLVAGHAAAQPAQKSGLTVMTQNVYFGADILALAGIEEPAAFIAAARATLVAVASTDFRHRANALSREIAERRPDVVALQEVYDLKLNSQNGAPPFVDYLETLLSALRAQGTPYALAAGVRNLNLNLPMDMDGDGTLESIVTVVDRDVILARKELVDAGAVAPVPLSGVCARPSTDGGPGCNYSVVATAATPLGNVAFERGFVAVDIALNGKMYRVVDTHLEVRTPDPRRPESAFIQASQATELKALLEAATPSDRSLVILGDMNSDPHDAIEFGVPPYLQFALGLNLFGQPAGASYADAWVLRPGAPSGNSCCQAEDLRNRWPTLDQRIDLVFSREVPVDVKANLVGNEPADRANGLWPSDHAGLVVRFVF